MANSFEEEWERPEFDSVPILARQILYRLPQADDTAVRFALLDVYRDFCKRSTALRTWRRMEIEPGRGRYPVVPVLSGMVDCVTNVVWGVTRQPLRGWRIVGDPPALEVPHWWAGHDFAPPSKTVAYVQTKPNVGSLPIEVKRGECPAGCSAWNVWVEAVEIPHIHEERAPRRFLERYGDAIANGAYARLASQTNRPWSDAAQAQFAATEYENAVSEARQRSAQGGPAVNPGPTFAVDMSGAI